MKKVIVISTSLRTGSNSDMLADQFIEGAKAAGHEVEKISAPCMITILETYASVEAYRKHTASAHFQKYKQGTLKHVLEYVPILIIRENHKLSISYKVLQSIFSRIATLFL